MPTSHITVSPAAIPLPPSPAALLTPQPPQQQAPKGAVPAATRASRAPAFPAHLRPAVAPLQPPPTVLPRHAVPQPGPQFQQATALQYAQPAGVMPGQGYAIQPQQLRQGSAQGQFEFQPVGQPPSLQSHSTPSMSGRTVPRFLEEAWQRGEPGPSGNRQGPPPLPGTSPAACLTSSWICHCACVHRQHGRVLLSIPIEDKLAAIAS